MAVKSNSIDMIHGGLWGKILKFSLLFMLTSFLQHLYSAADIIVVSRFAGEHALAGVGVSGSITNLFLNFILGFSAGASIVIGQALGARDEEKISRAAHTAISIAVYGGLFMMLMCLIFAKQLLTMMDTPENVMPQATVYLRIVALGYMPSLIYNFGAAILRAKGDTKRALYVVSISGLINVGLNLLFVVVFKMEAAGVALATIISQIFTAVVILYYLSKEEDQTKIYIRKIRIYTEPFLNILKFGIPSAIQSAFYTVSNLIVQSSINTFGSAAIAGSAATSSVTDFYNTMVNSFYQGSLVFCSQNFGAKNFDRIKKTVKICITYVLALGVIQALITTFADEFLLGIYIDAAKEPEVMTWALKKISVQGYSYFLLGLMNIMTGALRGMGASALNMVMAIIGVCGIRIVWIVFAFPLWHTFEGLFMCFPLSWLGTFCMHFIMYSVVFKKEKKKHLLQQ